MNKYLKSVSILFLLFSANFPAKAEVEYTVKYLGNFSPIAINSVTGRVNFGH